MRAAAVIASAAPSSNVSHCMSTPELSALPRTLVVHHLSGIGDLVWHLPYLRAIAAQSALGQISVMARPSCRAADVLAAEDCIEEVIEYDRWPRPDEARIGRHASWRSQWRFAVDLRRRRFDRVYVFSSRVRYPILALLAGIPTRAGFGFNLPQRLLLNCPPYIARYRGTGNPVFPQATALSVAHGFVEAAVTPRMRVLQAHQDAAALLLADLQGLRYAFSIGTSVPRKQWGAQRFAALAAALLQRGHSCILLGGPAEQALATEIAASIPAACQDRLVISTAASVQRSAALLQRCDVCVGNDTAVLNMAAANGVLTLGLFGCTPVLGHDPLIHGLTGSSMQDITVAQVLEKLHTLAPMPSAAA